MDHTTTTDSVANSVGVITTPFTNDLGAHAAPANVLSADTIHSDDVNVNAPIDASHLSLCYDASHLSACTAETQVSTITEDSMLNLEPHQEPGMPSSGERVDTSPRFNSTKGLAQFRIDCPAGSTETHEIAPMTGNQFQRNYSNNTDNPCSRNGDLCPTHAQWPMTFVRLTSGHEHDYDMVDKAKADN
jgi:hypothetical protein